MTAGAGADGAAVDALPPAPGSSRSRGPTIEGSLLGRAFRRWLLLRLLLLAVAAFATLTPEEAWELYSAGTTAIVVMALAPALAEVEVRRRHERALLENLGVSLQRRLLLAALPAVLCELLLARVLS